MCKNKQNWLARVSHVTRLVEEIKKEKPKINIFFLFRFYRCWYSLSIGKFHSAFIIRASTLIRIWNYEIILIPTVQWNNTILVGLVQKGLTYGGVYVSGEGESATCQTHGATQCAANPTLLDYFIPLDLPLLTLPHTNPRGTGGRYL